MNLRLKNSKLIGCLLLMLIIFSCKPKKNMVYLEDANHENETISLAKAQYKGMQLQPSDVIEINVNAYDDLAAKPFNKSSNTNVSEKSSGLSTFSGSMYSIDADGYINMPTLGRIYVEGMTKKELTTEINNRLIDYLKDPVVSVEFQNFSVSVMGEVNKPGQVKSVSDKLNVLQAISMAGDMTEFGDRTKVKLVRDAGENDEIIILDVNDQNLVSSPYYYLKQNDILYVTPDENKQIYANQNPNSRLWLQVGGFALSIVTLIITLTK